MLNRIQSIPRLVRHFIRVTADLIVFALTAWGFWALYGWVCPGQTLDPACIVIAPALATAWMLVINTYLKDKLGLDYQDPPSKTNWSEKIDDS